MKEYEDLLQRLNLSPTASKVYLVLLETGKSTADIIARKAHTYKANAYDALGRLEHAGLVTSHIEHKKRLFAATSPEKIEAILDDKEHQEILKFELVRRSLQEALPKLQAVYNSAKEKDVFEIHRGRQAYKSLIAEILKEKPAYWKGFGNLQIYDLFHLEFHRWFKDIPIKLFSAKSDVVVRRFEEAKASADVKIKWLPQGVHMPIVWVVFGENLLIVVYEPEVIVIRIKSGQIVKTFSSQFDYLWSTNKAHLSEPSKIKF